MRAFVTGATGFLGGRLTAKLRERGDEVVALVRTPSRASGLDAELLQGDLSDRDALAERIEGCDVVFHLAARYEVGIPPSQRAATFEATYWASDDKARHELGYAPRGPEQGLRGLLATRL